MKATQLGRLLCSSFFVVCLFNPAIAQESFTISGPIDSFSFFTSDGTSEVDATSFSATVRFDPGAPATVTEGQEGVYAESYFEPAIIDIEFSVFDDMDGEIVKVTNSSASGLNVNNYVNVFDDLARTLEDQILYELFVQSSSDDSGDLTGSTAGSSRNTLNRMAILFGDNSGGMVSDPTQLPPPPGIGDFNSSRISVLFMESGVSNDTEFFNSMTATGEITSILFEESSPYDDCAEQARNHGEYVSCVSQVNNVLRSTGEITGKQKGQLQKQAARSKSK